MFSSWSRLMATLVILSMANGISRAQPTPFTHIDSLIHNFLIDELRLWDSINSHANTTQNNARNVSLTEVYNFFNSELNLNYGKADVVRPFNWHLAHYIEQVNRTQKTASLYLTQHNEELRAFAEKQPLNLQQVIGQIFDETKKLSFLDFIRESSDYCHPSKRNSHRDVYNMVTEFYSTVVEALLKGYMVSQMSYMILGINGPLQKYQKSSSEWHRSFSSQYHTLEFNVQQIVKNHTGEIWICDDFTEPESYTEITNFIQGYVENEVNFNRDGSCTSSCSDYLYTRQHGCRNNTMCHVNFLDKNKTRCDGFIRDCTFIESDMTVCTNEDDSVLSRRYHYIRYSSGLLLGRGQFCPEEVELKSWTRWFVACSACFCYCDNEGPFSDRYISLREALSDISLNKVVTGIRLLKRFGIIHLFITERSFQRHGRVDENAESVWKGDYQFTIEDTGVEDDYFTLTWANRAIELDTILVPDGEVVTGVRFRFVDGRLRFEIRSTPFNHDSGSLSQDLSVSRWNGNNDHFKTQIKLQNVDVPTRSARKSVRDRRSGVYIEFTPTDIYMDAAQTTVPFIDTQPVEPKHPRPLNGAGLYYKTPGSGYGGYIAPLIISDFPIHPGN